MPLDIASVRARLRGRQIVWLDHCGSTMTEAAKLAALGCASGTVAGTEEQTSGQGRFGRTWHSEREAGLYVSIVLRLELPEESVRVLSMALGLAAAEAIARATDTACDIRWPNDLLIGDKKCAGILVQVERDAFIAGIGINVNQAAFSEQVQALATSLRLSTGRLHSRECVLVELLGAVDRFVRTLSEHGREPILAMFERASSYVRGKRVAVEQGGRIIEGVTDGIDASGFLWVRRDDGTRTLILAGGVRPA